MRAIPDPRLFGARVRNGPLGSDDSWGSTGCFIIQGPRGEELKIIASNADFPDSEGWEHVSVSTRRRCPNWPEMCFVKSLFWAPDETVVQFHPPEADYVNNHSFCLHLWRDTQKEPRRPPAILVGVKDLGVLA
jgi:hypothetical protein